MKKIKAIKKSKLLINISQLVDLFPRFVDFMPCGISYFIPHLLKKPILFAQNRLFMRQT